MFYLRKRQLDDLKMSIIKLFEVHGFEVTLNDDGSVTGTYLIRFGNIMALGRDITVTPKDAEAFNHVNNFMQDIVKDIREAKEYLHDRMAMVDIRDLSQANAQELIDKVNLLDKPVK